jgi:hypothetical protein
MAPGNRAVRGPWSATDSTTAIPDCPGMETRWVVSTPVDSATSRRQGPCTSSPMHAMRLVLASSAAAAAA